MRSLWFSSQCSYPLTHYPLTLKSTHLLTGDGAKLATDLLGSGDERFSTASDADNLSQVTRKFSQIVLSAQYVTD